LVWLTKRGRPLAALVSRDEYARLRAAATRRERGELVELLTESRELVAKGGVDPSVVEEALDAARRLS
jgi:PHD/YefM family antitoxin component YafN of YafNO toxin-antitoxin module